MGLQETDSCVAASSQFVPSTSEHHLVSSWHSSSSSGERAGLILGCSHES